jgi:hypothetical protein
MQGSPESKENSNEDPFLLSLFDVRAEALYYIGVRAEVRAKDAKMRWPLPYRPLPDLPYPTILTPATTSSFSCTFLLDLP